MSPEAPSESAADQGPSPQGATAGQRARSVPPVIDLEATPEPHKADAHKTLSPIMLKALGIGALAGALAGAITVLLIYSLVTRAPEDLAKRLATLETHQAQTPAQDVALDQKINALDQKNTLTAQKTATLDEKLLSLENEVSSVKAALAALPRNHIDADLAALSARIDTLTLALETLSAKPAHDQTAMIARVAGGLSLALRIHEKMQAGLALERDLAALDALQIDGLSLTSLRSALESTRPVEKSESVPTESQLSNDVVSKFWTLLSRLVTISPADKPADTSKSSKQNASLVAVDRLIDDLTARLVEESAAP